MKTKTTKPSPIQDRASLETLISEIATLRVSERLLRAAMDDELQTVREQYEPLLAQRVAALETKLGAVQTWCEKNRAEFGRDRSLTLRHGTVGWRMSGPALKTISGWDWDRVKDRLKTIGAIGYVRVKEEVNKSVLLADREAIGPEKLRAIGLQVTQQETFFVDDHLTEAPQPATAASIPSN